MTKPTAQQLRARKASLEKVLDSDGGLEALPEVLARYLEGDLLFDVLKAFTAKGPDTLDVCDAIKTWAENNTDWRLVQQDEVLDEEKHIDADDREAVISAAEALNLLVYTDAADMKGHFDGIMIDSNDEAPFDRLLESMELDDHACKAIASSLAENDYEARRLGLWLELYGLELRRRGERVA